MSAKRTEIDSSTCRSTAHANSARQFNSPCMTLAQQYHSGFGAGRTFGGAPEADRAGGAADVRERGPGFGGGGGTAGGELDPLIAANDADKPLLSKLLAVPALRTRYLGYVRDIADKWLDWDRLGPLAQRYQTLIAADVQADTRKLDSFEAFQNGLASDTEEQGFRGPRRKVSLRRFAEQRRAFLLSHPEVRKASL